MPFLVVEEPSAGWLVLVLRHLDLSFAASAEEHSSAHSQMLVPFLAGALLASFAGRLQLRLQLSQLSFLLLELERSKVSQELPLARSGELPVPSSLVPKHQKWHHWLQAEILQ